MKHIWNKTIAIVAVVAGIVILVFNAISPAWASFAATDILGQLNGVGNPNFNQFSINSGQAGTVDYGLNSPSAIVLDKDNHRLFVADRNNNRVLVFLLNTDNDIVSHHADYVIGQPDFVSSDENQGGLPAANTLKNPSGLSYTNGGQKLFVSDTGNNRVLIFNVTTITNNMSAYEVIGQPDFISNTANQGVSQNAQTLYTPVGIDYDEIKNYLYVADFNNDRVLVFDLSVPGNNRSAIYVLGKPTMTTVQPGFASQTRFNKPRDVSFDPLNERLFVADYQNRRVVVFDVRAAGSTSNVLCPLIPPAQATTGLADGMPGSCRIGQPNWTTNIGGNTAYNFQLLFGVEYDYNKELLYTLDQTSRLLVFDLSTIEDYPKNAVSVFGQPDFTSVGSGDHSATGLYNPVSAAINPIDGSFYIADTGNNRVLKYEFISITTNSMSNGTVGFYYSEPISYIDSQGIVSMEIVSGSLPPGLTLSGTSITGTPTVPGVYDFFVRAVDDSGGSGTFYSQTIKFTITVDLLPAGVTVGAVSGDTTEAGSTSTFSLVLNSPTLAGQNVTINLSSGDPTEGTVSPSSVTFTTANWDIPQTVTITGVDDLVADGNVYYSIVTGNTVSTYSEYDNLAVPDVFLYNIDDDIPNYLPSAISGHTTEALGTATFTFKLATQPTGDVVIPLSSSDPTEGTVSPSSLTFTTSNWNINQTVTVTGVDDNIDDGDVPYSVITGTAVTSDSVYAALTTPDITVINDDDDDTVGVTVSEISNNTSESGDAATFSVVLNSEPLDDVTISLMSSDTSEGVISISSLIFTTTNWNIPQVVTVTGVDDSIYDGDVSYSIITGDSVSLDPGYSGMIVDDVLALNLDNDPPPPPGGGVVIIENFDLQVIRQTTPTTADLRFIISSAGGGSNTTWLMVYSTDSSALATMTKVPWVPQMYNVTIPRGARYVYAQYFDANDPNHKSQVLSRPLQTFEQTNTETQNFDPSTCTPYINSYMSLGGANNSLEVVKLQTFLRDEEGFSNVRVNGVYDRATYNAVVNFQERYFSDVLAPWFNQHGTGRVFVTTKKKINEIHCARISKPVNECRYFTEYARLGGENNPEEVQKIRSFLQNEMFLTGDSSTSGLYDDLLSDAVRRFQAKYSGDIVDPWGQRNAESSGWWYITTQAKANQIYCSSS